jgi:hypothetical protein
MPALSGILIAASGAIMFALGAMHLVFTYSGSKLHPRDAAVIDAMKAGGMRISRETTVWRAATGFHGSHSLGAMLFGLVYGYLALEGTGFLFSSAYLLSLGMLTLCAYLVLAKLYWFKIPFRGILLATVLYAAALLAKLS